MLKFRMQKCSVCNIEKQDSEFYQRKDGRKNYRCLSCYREYRKQHYDNHRDYYIDKAKRHKSVNLDRARRFILSFLSENPCIDCGCSDPRCLQFDHRGEKSFEISIGVNRQYSNEKLASEIEKCDVRCANCHAIKTSEQFGFYKERYINE